MNLRILKRRAEMLDAVSTGLHPSAVATCNATSAESAAIASAKQKQRTILNH